MLPRKPNVFCATLLFFHSAALFLLSAKIGGVQALSLGPDLKERTGPEEADIEFDEEIHLPQDDGDGVFFCPRESEPDR